MTNLIKMADAEGNQQAQIGNLVYVWKIPLDKSYVKSPDSKLKLLAAVLALLSYICCALGRTDKCDASTYNYFEFVAMTTFLTILILWFFRTVSLWSSLFFDMLYFNLMDMIFCVIFSLLFMTALGVLGKHSCDKNSDQGAIGFGFFTICALSYDTCFSLGAWREARKQSTSDNSKSSDYNPDRNMEKY